MINIPPQDRYDQHAASVNISNATVLKAASHFLNTSKEVAITKLSGGFQNGNYLVLATNQRFVIRIFSTDMDTASREVALLKFLEGHDVKAPRALDLFQSEDRPVAILEYLEGENLQSAFIQDPNCFFQIGEQLAKIHSIEFQHAGFIGPNMTINSQFETFESFLKEFILNTLHTVQEDRLASSVRDRLARLVEDKWPLTEESEPFRQLVHCDFNPKNIMISPSNELSGVLDWEFSLAGNGYLDLGNFFRFSNDYPDKLRRAFIDGYKSTLPLREDWREVSLLMDLGNMCSFLERRENYPKTFHTARTIIEETLSYFAY